MKQAYPISLLRTAILGVPLFLLNPAHAVEPKTPDTAAEVEEAEAASEPAADEPATPAPEAMAEESTAQDAAPAADSEPATTATPAPEAETETNPAPGADRERPGRAGRSGAGQSPSPETTARPEQPERPAGPERAERPGRPERRGADPANRAERADRTPGRGRGPAVSPAEQAETPGTTAEPAVEMPTARAAGGETDETPSAEETTRRRPADREASSARREGEGGAGRRAGTPGGVEPVPVPEETLAPETTPAAPAARERDMGRRPAPTPEPEVAAAPPAPPAQPAPQMSEPEQQAETQVREATREVERELDQRKARVETREDAQALFNDIIGSESRISRAEVAREERLRPRMQEMRRGSESSEVEITSQHREETVTYFERRLMGESFDGPPPAFLHRGGRDFGPSRRGGRDTQIIEETVVERVEFERPRYLHEGRRYVHFDSRASVPAILMAAQAMNYVEFHRAPEVGPMLYERRNVSAPNAMPLPPEAYRGEDSVVISYPVDEASMISSDDILFQQGSTQFADPYSYEIVAALGDAMRKTPEEARFVVEGHASAEGSFESNMILSQQRAERIVREVVRQGVSPYRLLPVGYGESEARHPENAAESIRSQDRRVVVFRLKEEPIAAR